MDQEGGPGPQQGEGVLGRGVQDEGIQGRGAAVEEGLKAGFITNSHSEDNFSFLTLKDFYVNKKDH